MACLVGVPKVGGLLREREERIQDLEGRASTLAKDVKYKKDYDEGFRRGSAELTRGRAARGAQTPFYFFINTQGCPTSSITKQIYYTKKKL